MAAIADSNGSNPNLEGVGVLSLPAFQVSVGGTAEVAKAAVAERQIEIIGFMVTQSVAQGSLGIGWDESGAFVEKMRILSATQTANASNGFMFPAGESLVVPRGVALKIVCSANTAVHNGFFLYKLAS